MNELKNIFASIPEWFPAEIYEVLLNASQVRIERIVSQSHASPDGFWYDQPQHEWVIVLQGAGSYVSRTKRKPSR